MQVPILTKEPTEKELRDLNGAPYILRPAYAVSGLHLLSLYFKYFNEITPESIPIYSGEQIQSFENRMNWC